MSSDTTIGTSSAKGRNIMGLAVLQRIGRSLMLPIAVLPAAGLLLRIGQDDLLGSIAALGTVASVISGGGGAIFAALPLIFAVGVAVGFTKKADGSTALAAVVGYVVIEGVFEAMSPVVLGEEEGELINYGVLAGIVIGIVASVLWQRYHRITLPTWLGFFGGRRFVPIVTAFAALLIGVVMALIYPAFDAALTGIGEWVAGSAVVGAGVYGTVNRLLIPLGLHHIINSVVWFLIGEYEGARGDLNRFFAGDPDAGTFMTGFFPIMMFALPAAALAIWHEARPERRKLVGGIMISAAITSLVTGITEPLEFAFMFVAWPLYVIHAVLTGTSMALVNALDVHHGFTFSAGLIDYMLNFGIAEKPLLLLPIGLGYGAVYYFLFRFVIRRWNLRTPGRDDDDNAGYAEPQGDVSAPGAAAGSARPKRGEARGTTG